MDAWLYLLLAIVLEVLGTTCMKLSDGFARIIPSVLVFVLYGLSIALLNLSLRKLDVSVAYAVWAGLGVVLVTLIGVMLFREPLSILKIGCIALIIIGVIGLNLMTSTY